jgi:hypothetical protein
LGLTGRKESGWSFFFGKKKETQNNNKTRRGERNAQRTQRRAVICIIFQFDPKGTEEKQNKTKAPSGRGRQ